MSAEKAGRGDAGKIVPRVPHLPPREGADRGVAGSLVQLRERERAQRLADRRPAAHDWRLYTAGVMVAGAATAAITGWRLLDTSATGLLLLVISVTTLAGALLVAMARYEPGDVERDVAGAVRREKYAARELEKLRGLGWTVMHDRLVPGTEHRLSHVLVGPAGIIIASVAPSRDALRLGGETLYAGATPLDEWFATRWWEAETLNAATTEHLNAWSWQGPVFPLVIVDEQRFGAPRWRWGISKRRTVAAVPGHPLIYTRIAIRDVEQIRRWVTALPAPLGALTSAQLAATIEDLCAPAATRE